jgi:hypothetical protein
VALLKQLVALAEGTAVVLRYRTRVAGSAAADAVD